MTAVAVHSILHVKLRRSQLENCAELVDTREKSVMMPPSTWLRWMVPLAGGDL